MASWNLSWKSATKEIVELVIIAAIAIFFAYIFRMLRRLAGCKTRIPVRYSSMDPIHSVNIFVIIFVMIKKKIAQIPVRVAVVTGLAASGFVFYGYTKNRREEELKLEREENLWKNTRNDGMGIGRDDWTLINCATGNAITKKDLSWGY